MKNFLILALFILLSILSGCDATTQDYSTTSINTDTEIVSQETTQQYTNYVTVKYRNEPVDIASFEELDTSKSSFIRGAWYEETNEYMIIDLNWIKYHYCRLSSSEWDSFKMADSFGTYYNSYIKWNYDCRNWGMPSY